MQSFIQSVDVNLDLWYLGLWAWRTTEKAGPDRVNIDGIKGIMRAVVN